MKKPTRFSRRLLSSLLALMTLLSVIAVGLIGVQAAVLELSPAEAPEAVYFVVPEVIYLRASLATTATAVPVQYFVDNPIGDPTVAANQKTWGSLSTTNNKTTGDVWFKCENATSVKIEASSSIGFTARTNQRTSLNAAGTAYTNTALTNQAVNSQAAVSGDFLYYRLFADTAVGTAATTGCAANNTPGLVTWTATYVVDGKTYTATAYTYVYKPQSAPTAIGQRLSRGSATQTYDGATTHFLTWVNGLHNNIPGRRDLRAVTATAPTAANSIYHIYTLLAATNAAYLISAAAPATNTNANSSFGNTIANYYYTTNGAGFISDRAGSADYFALSAGSAFNNKTQTSTSATANNIVTDWPQLYKFGDASFTTQAHRDAMANTTNLFIDTSRYTNMNQIPQLSVYAMKNFFYNGSAAGNTEFGANAAQTNFIAWDADSNMLNNPGVGTETNYPTSTGVTALTVLGDVGPNSAGNYTGLGTDGTKATASLYEWSYTGTGSGFSGGGAFSTCNAYVKQGGPIGIDISATQYTNPSLVFRSSIKMHANTMRMHTRTYIPLKIEYTNKGGLRDKMKEIIGDYKNQTSSAYTNGNTAAWTTYQTRVQELASGLCQPNATPNVTTLINNVNSAKAALTPVVPANGTATGKDFNIATNAQIGTDTTLDYTYGDTVTGKPSTISGYQYVNMTGPAGASTAASVDVIASTPTQSWNYYYAPIFNVVYDNNEGTGVIAPINNIVYGVTNVTGQTLSNGAAFDKANCELIGWNTQADGLGTDYALGAPLSNTLKNAPGDFTLYAVWNKLSYDVVYNPNGGTGTAYTDADNEWEEPYTVLANSNAYLGFAKDKYAFNGWNTQANGLGADYSEGQVIDVEDVGPLTLYAKWLGNNYSVSYKANGGSGADVSDGGQYGVAYTVLGDDVFSKDNYVFTGWNTQANGLGTAYAAGDVIAATNDTRPLELYAQWEGELFEVNYEPNGGDGAAYTDGSGQYGVAYTVDDTTYTRANYTFACWNTKADGTGTDYAEGATIPAAGAGPLTLYAKWLGIPFEVDYDPNGGEGVAYTDGAGRYGSAYSVLSNSNANLRYAKAGFNLSGWNTAADGTGTAYALGASIPAAEAGVMTLYAQWAPAGGGGGCGSSICFSWLYDSLLYFFMGFGWMSSGR